MKTSNMQGRQAEEALLTAGALQRAILNSANFSSSATDAKGVIQIFNVGAERMPGYTAAEVMNKITPADISDPQEVIARAAALSAELETPITPIHVGEAGMAHAFSSALFEEGLWATGIGFPTVQKGKARIRTIVTAGHTREHLDRAVETLTRVARRMEILKG